MRFPCLLPLLALALLLPTAPMQAQTPAASDLRPLASDTWVATDALGRQTPTAAQTRPARAGRFVGVFYFLTHGSRAYFDQPGVALDYGTYGDDPRTLRDNTQIIAASGGSPLTKSEAWKDGGTYWWGQPAVGYFLADDPWVARKNLQMLADAGVDTLIFDVTNAPQYSAAYTNVLDTAEQMRREGSPTPQFMFITHASTGPVANSLYDAIYAKGRYKDLWFQWDGKPMMLGDKTGSGPNKTPMRPEVQAFFTWRTSWAWDPGQDKWQWLDKYPQRPGWHTDPNVPEEVSVSVAGHATESLGRSYHSDEIWGHGTEPPVDAQSRTDQSDKGIQFAQQWQRALQINPQFIFITGWNEWTAGRQYAPGVTMLGHVTQPGQYYFVDEYNEEFSRDAMPMKGGFGDNYYMQLVDGIRQFKGVHPLSISHGFHTPGRMLDWKTITPEYLDAAGDATHRDWPGWGGKQYTDNSGRNDMAAAKVACDAKNIYFYVRVQNALTPFTGPNWMQLLIDADENPRTGWNGYDYVVNSRVTNRSMTTLKRLSDGKVWPVHYRAAGSEIQVTVPRALLGLTHAKRTTFDFHWIDNAPVGGDPKQIADWWYVGDSAPDGRFNYRYLNTQ